MSMRLMDQMRNVLRRRRYSIHTERTYCDWVRKYVWFHGMKSRADLDDAERKISEYLTHLAVNCHVARATQNQALNSLVFLYKQVLEHPLSDEISAERAAKKQKIPVVMTRDEVGRVISLIPEAHRLVVQLLYGSGLRIAECLCLRVHAS